MTLRRCWSGPSRRPARLAKRLLRSPEALPGLQFQKAAMGEDPHSQLAKDKSLIGFVGRSMDFVYLCGGRGPHKGSLQAGKRSLSLFNPFCEILIPLLVENIRFAVEVRRGRVL